MKIREILAQEKPVLSFEVFPPKAENKYDVVERAVAGIAGLSPSFMSVTYGAGGGTSRYTVKIASGIEKNYGVTALAHLSCVTSKKEMVRQAAEEMKAQGIENVLALRGDIPADGNVETDYHYASELVHDLKTMGDFCIGGACYPEGHVESKNKEEDLCHLKEKVDAGCDFLTTQMFFDRFKAIVDKFGENPAAMRQAGVAYATEQIIDLIANGVHAVHVYSMNRPEVAKQIKESLSEILV